MIKNYLDNNFTSEGTSFGQSLEKALEGDGEALGNFVMDSIGVGVEGAARDVAPALE